MLALDDHQVVKQTSQASRAPLGRCKDGPEARYFHSALSRGVGAKLGVKRYMVAV